MIYSLCFILNFVLINIKQNNKESIYPRSKIGMEEEKVILNKEYERITPRIGYYIKSKNIAKTFKEKCPLFAAGGDENIINLFSNSLEQMGYFSGHKDWIWCLCPISTQILASGSDDRTIKIWNIEDRSIISTLSGHTDGVNALCNVKEGVLVSGSYDNSLIIWSKSRPKSSIFSSRQTLRGHRSNISGIIRLNNTEIVSGEYKGDLMMWNIDQGLCIRHIPRGSEFDYLHQMKQHIGGDVVVSYENNVKVWGAANNWGNAPNKLFDVKGWSIEFLDGDLLLRGGEEGQLEFIDYIQTGCDVYSIIMGLHSKYIYAIQRIAKNIVITASDDGYLKVIHPIYRKCYLKFNARKPLYALAYFY